MSKYRILIADDDRKHLAQVQGYFSGQDEVLQVDVVTDGFAVLERLRERSYDAMLMDLVMPRLDGFGVLEQVRACCTEEEPMVMIVSAIHNEGMVRNACALGARYFMVKPVEPDTLYKRMLDMLMDVPAQSGGAAGALLPQRSLDEKIAEVFLVAGIPAHIKGYHYLREGIRMVYQSPEMINRITKELYPGIADRFETSSSKVERAIRHAIEVAWARGRIENINQLFGYVIYSKHDKPTNGEFIALVADKLLMEQGREGMPQVQPRPVATA